MRAYFNIENTLRVFNMDEKVNIQQFWLSITDIEWELIRVNSLLVISQLETAHKKEKEEKHHQKMKEEKEGNSCY